jgi:hypothetical protein
LPAGAAKGRARVLTTRSTPLSRVTNRDGDHVAKETWKHARRSDDNDGRAGSTFDKSRTWYREAHGVQAVDGRLAGVRLISLFEYLDSAEARADPGGALKVARRAILREAMAIRVSRSDATDIETNAGRAMLGTGVVWSKKVKKMLKGIGESRGAGDGAPRGSRGHRANRGQTGPNGRGGGQTGSNASRGGGQNHGQGRGGADVTGGGGGGSGPGGGAALAAPSN